MKKLIALALLAALLTLALTACSDLLPGGKPAATRVAEATATPAVTDAPAAEAPEVTAEATATPAA